MNPIQSITSTMIDASTQTKSFDELVKEHMQEKLPKDIFELPEEAYDPVTYEPLTPNVSVTCCGHTFKRETILAISIKEKLTKINDKIHCPICRSYISVVNDINPCTQMGKVVDKIINLKKVMLGK